MFRETYCGSTISPVKTIGIMQIHELPEYRSLKCPKYVVFHENGLALKEIRTRKEAFKWEQNNQK